MGKESKEKPIHTVRFKAISVAIWESEHEKKKYYTVTPQRAFTRDDGKSWEYSTSFSTEDAPVLASLLNKAFAWITDETSKAK